MFYIYTFHIIWKHNACIVAKKCTVEMKREGIIQYRKSGNFGHGFILAYFGP
jgi:hypothetical protein